MTLIPEAKAALSATLAGEDYPAELVDYLGKAARTAITIRCTRAKGELALGASRIGGHPDLPIGFVWPSGAQPGTALTFVAQVNLADLPATDLPRQGWLLFFVDVDEPAWDIGHQVVQLSADTELTRGSFPSDRTPALAEALDGATHFPPCSASFAVTFELDPTDLPDPEDLFEADDLDDLDDLSMTGHSCLLGVPALVLGDPREEAYLCAQGMEPLIHQTYLHPDEVATHYRGTAEQAKRLVPLLEDWWSNQARHHAGMKKWQQLFRLASESSADMLWWDAGYLQFLIHSDDLRAGDFSKTYACIATS